MKNLIWALAGAATLLVMMVAVFHYQPESAPQEVVSKAKRQQVVARMRVALATAVEAEKSAVLATTDRDSRGFAAQARTATAEVDQTQNELAGLLSSQPEKDLLSQFSKSFTELRRVDEELLALAV